MAGFFLCRGREISLLARMVRAAFSKPSVLNDSDTEGTRLLPLRPAPRSIPSRKKIRRNAGFIIVPREGIEPPTPASSEADCGLYHHPIGMSGAVCGIIVGTHPLVSTPSLQPYALQSLVRDCFLFLESFPRVHPIFINPLPDCAPKSLGLRSTTELPRRMRRKGEACFYFFRMMPRKEDEVRLPRRHIQTM